MKLSFPQDFSLKKATKDPVQCCAAGLRQGLLLQHVALRMKIRGALPRVTCSQCEHDEKYALLLLGHMTCIGQWSMTRGGVCCFVAETLRTVAVSSTGLFSMSDSNTSLLGIWNPEGGNVEQRHGQPTAEIYQEQ